MKTSFILGLLLLASSVSFQAYGNPMRPLAQANIPTARVIPGHDRFHRAAPSCQTPNHQAPRCHPQHVMPGQDRGRGSCEIPLSLMNPSPCYYPARVITVPCRRQVIVIEDPYYVPYYGPEFNFEISFRGSRRC